jgi:uncharacterized Zn-finger protein
MAHGATPHFHNDMGLPMIEVGAREFMCVGARPPFDHPHVFLDMGPADELVCPYCSTLYKYNGELGDSEARPAAAVWTEAA